MLIGLAVTLDPLPLTAFMVVLPSKRGARKGAAFLLGWLPLGSPVFPGGHDRMPARPGSPRGALGPGSEMGLLALVREPGARDDLRVGRLVSPYDRWAPRLEPGSPG